jgi:enoyl-CoA hydratase
MSDTEYQHVRVSRRHDVQIVTLNRPQALNALNSELLDELGQVISDAKYDPATSLLIITGEGEKAFCAGADLAELQHLDYFAAKLLLEKGQAVFRQLELLGKPTIAAINGYALGGGLELALACTIRLAGTNAKLALPEVKLGMIPGYGGTQRLPRLIGKGKALELMVTGRRIDAHEALSLGIVSRVVEPAGLIDAALQLAEEILQGSLIAVSQLLQAVERGMDLPMDHALALETVLDAIAAASEDQREGIAAFMEKRQPLFRHRQKRGEDR